jgi:hypothetical protein
MSWAAAGTGGRGDSNKDTNHDRPKPTTPRPVDRDESITHERPDPEGEAPTKRVTEAPDTRINSAGEVVTREDLKSGFKADGQKERMDLLPPNAMLALGDLFKVGSLKYSDRNWELGMSWGRMLAAMLRHIFKFMRGEDHDEVDGQHHLISVAWCALCLYEFTVCGKGTDDRTKLRKTSDSED